MPEGRRAAELQHLILEIVQRKHSVAARFLLQADELTERLLDKIDDKDGPNPDSLTNQEDQMGLFHGMQLREGQFTGVIHVGKRILSCQLADVHKDILNSAIACVAKHQFKEALSKVKELRDLGNGPIFAIVRYS